MARNFTVTTYTNKHGKARLSVMMPREQALLIAARDAEALIELQEAVRVRIEREEVGDEGVAPDDTA